MTHFPLPELDDGDIAAMEGRIVTAHRGERTARRRRVLGIAGATAGVIIVAGLIGPMVTNGGMTSVSGSRSSTADYAVPVSPEQAPAVGGSADSSADSGGRSSGSEGLTEVSGAAGATGTATDSREIATTASATLTVSSVPDALAAITATASDLGGYVESSSSSSGDGGASPVSPLDGSVSTEGDSGAVPDTKTGSGSAYISIRIPADRLADAQSSLGSVGTVTDTSVNRQDVTTQTVDLRARISAAQTSVDRLTALLAQSANVSDLIAAETALATRQAELESLQQQLTAVESQVSLSTLTVSLVSTVRVSRADPAGFLDGFSSGVNALVVAANGTLIGLGFLLPWLALAAAVTAIVVTVRRIRGRRRV